MGGFFVGKRKEVKHISEKIVPNNLTKPEQIGQRILQNQAVLGGTIIPCDGCPVKIENTLCGDARGIQIGSDGKPYSPRKGVQVKLIVR
jgi:hypothetical protein